MLVQSGDSIGAGATAGGYVAIEHLGFPDGVMIHNVSISGYHLTEAYAARETTLFPFYDPAHPSILLIQLGTNDLGQGVTADEIYGRFATAFIQAAQAKGFYVVIGTILPRADSGWTAAMEQQRQIYNRLVRANAAGADGVDDVAANPYIGDGVDPANSIFYSDALHLSAAGQMRLAQSDAQALVPFISRRPR